MPNSPNIDTVVFDLGGVLIDWNPVYLFRQIFEDESEMHHFLTHVCSPHWNEQQDAGRSVAEATELLVREHPQYEAQIRAYYGRWEEMLGGPILGTVDILETLHSRGSHRLYALTNWSDETFPLALSRFDFLQRFEDILVSGKEKMKKPEPRIFHLMAERFGINPASAIFIDDNPRNVEVAEEIGFHAVRFHSPGQLREALAEKGILY